MEAQNQKTYRPNLELGAKMQGHIRNVSKLSLGVVSHEFQGRVSIFNPRSPAEHWCVRNWHLNPAARKGPAVALYYPQDTLRVFP